MRCPVFHLSFIYLFIYLFIFIYFFFYLKPRYCVVWCLLHDFVNRKMTFSAFVGKVKILLLYFQIALVIVNFGELRTNLTERSGPKLEHS